MSMPIRCRGNSSIGIAQNRSFARSLSIGGAKVENRLTRSGTTELALMLADPGPAHCSRDPDGNRRHVLGHHHAILLELEGVDLHRELLGIVDLAVSWVDEDPLGA